MPSQKTRLAPQSPKSFERKGRELWSIVPPDPPITAGFLIPHNNRIPMSRMVTHPRNYGGTVRRLFLVVAGAALLPAVAFAASLPQPQAVTSAASNLASLEQPGGGFGGGSIGANADAIVAIRAAGYDPAKLVASDGSTPVDYVKANATAATKDTDAAKLVLAAAAVGLDPTSISGTNVTAAISAGFDASTGRYAADDFSQAIAMLGLACTNNAVPAPAVHALESAQVQADGGWGYQGTSDPDTTAIAVQALLASGTPATDPAVTAAIGYFKANQLDDGGWGYPPASNVNSTAYVMQALIAAGEDPATYVKGGVNPVSYLVSQQQADGSFPGVSAEVATEQVLPALAGRTYCNAASTMISQQGTPPRESVTPTPTSTTATSTATPGTPTASATTPAASTPTPRETPRPTKEIGHGRTPSAPNSGSGTGASSNPAALLAGALALFAVASGLSVAALRRKR